MMDVRRSISRALICLGLVGSGSMSWSIPASAQRMHAFKEAYASEGSGSGQLLRPGAVAVNEETGDVYVIDRGNSRVEIFNEKGGYVGQFNGTVSPAGLFSWPALTVEEREADDAEFSEGSIAIDNSGSPLDPSNGDVYILDSGHQVIDKFTATGTYVSDIVATSTAPLYRQAAALAVNRQGMLWVLISPFARHIAEYNDSLSNEYVASIEPHLAGGRPIIPPDKGFAVDSRDNFYVTEHESLFPPHSPSSHPIELSSAGEELIEALDMEESTAFGVDTTNDDAYVDHRSLIAAYNAAHNEVERFGSGQLQESEGTTVDSSTGTVYATNASTGQVSVFASFVVPDVATGSVSNLGETSVTVSGTVNPDGLPVTSCVFEYGINAEYGQSEPCTPLLGSGSEPVEVSANLKGLQPLTRYHYRLRAANANGSNHGVDRTFLTPEPVTVAEPTVSDISATDALFSAHVDPGGAETTFQFEYGTTETYERSVPVPAGRFGAATTSEPVFVRVEELAPHTTYHMRLVATNLLGSTYGPVQTFTTQSAVGSSALPDGRRWEMVSPPVKEGALIAAIGEAVGAKPGLIQASTGGTAVSYYANGPIGEGVSGNAAPLGKTQILSTHGESGWSSQNINPPQQIEETSTYDFFSPDLSSAIVEQSAVERALPLSPEVSEQTPYIRDNITHSYLPLVTKANVPRETMFGPPRFEPPRPAAITPDFSHVILLSRALLTENAVEPSGNNVYEWSAGHLQLVNVLPDGTALGGASFGGEEYQDTRHALSNDGSRVFFQDSGTGSIGGHLYMRDTETQKTLQVDAAAPGVSVPPSNRAEFQIASADGSEVFFTDEEPLTADSTLKPVGVGGLGPTDLYAFDVPSGRLTDLTVDRNTGEQAGVQRLVLGASENGSVVYFVATGRLAEGAQTGQDNLYVESLEGASWSKPSLVAILSEEDNPDWNGTGTSNGVTELSHLTSRVSPEGRYLAFMSERSLTGYDNRDAITGQPDEEVFIYDRATGGLKCVSCDPTNARPDAVFEGENPLERPLFDRAGTWKGRALAASIPGWTQPNSAVGYSMSYQSRLLFDQGRLFFEAVDPLVAKDTNGKVDVYEYEPEGIGNCSSSSGSRSTTFESAQTVKVEKRQVEVLAGCVSLISSGASPEESVFLDASKDGNDVFFLTQFKLVPEDIDTSFDVYDAHVCVSPCVSPPVTSPSCDSGDSCKTAPSPQPTIFGAPPSATFNGAGNTVPRPTSKSKATPKRCAKGKARTRGRCVKRRAKRRRRRAHGGLAGNSTRKGK